MRPSDIRAHNVIDDCLLALRIHQWRIMTKQRVWDEFGEMVEPVTAKVPCIFAVGNHEDDGPGMMGLGAATPRHAGSKCT